MSRRKKSPNMSSAALTVVIVLLCMIFMANTWVSHEIEETQKISYPNNPHQPQNSLRNNRLAQGRSDYTRSGAHAMASLEEVGKIKPTKKREKIIYEIPLDDVNLVQ
ncbi:MAG: hypothetical protein K8I00_07535 [Candidatus Omnitrophica bacterium]|nr:hypothetical protein [Candidatus Omnitrophota bacterium]